MHDLREEALGFLFGRIDYERAPATDYSAHTFKLARMRDFLARLGNPQAGLPIVHVAGTKGKGSTAAMIATVLSAAGYRTGLFTSPHLHAIEERLAVDGQPATAEELVALVDRLRPVAEAMDASATASCGAAGGPTYFELTTAMALEHFRRRHVDVAVLEVGLGGRLDSTNVCRPAVSVITNISFDHMQQLGNTLQAIAREKAGIVKPGVPVVSGVEGAEPRAVIESISREAGSRLWQLGDDFEYAYDSPRHLEAAARRGLVDFQPRAEELVPAYAGLQLGLIGRHQAANAAVALTTLAVLRRAGWKLPETAVRRGLADVRCPARVEVLRRAPAVILDAAHNPASIRALVETLEESFAAEKRTVVFATSRGKDVAGMLQMLLPHFDKAVFTQYTRNPRAVPPDEVLSLVRGPAPPCVVCADPARAWDEVRGAGAGELVCITGSFFLAAEMRELIVPSGHQPALARQA